MDKLNVFAKDFKLRKYGRWQIFEGLFSNDESITLLHRKSVINKRLLLLNKSIAPEDLSIIKKIKSTFSTTIIHDYKNSSENTDIILNHGFKKSKDSQRLLNIATYWIDLTQSEDILWGNMGTKSRNMVRKAQKEGLQVRFMEECDESDVEDFLKIYLPLATKYKLSIPSIKQILLMIKNKNLFMAKLITTDKKNLVINLIYTFDHNALYLFGASNNSIKVTGAGQLLQWETMKYLKNKGYTEYDLGGLPTKDASDGISKFKKSLGGQYRDLGWEYIYTPFLHKSMYFLKNLIK